MASPGTRSSAESAGTAAAEGFLSLSGWGFAQAIASRSSSSACFTKGHRLGAIGCAGGAPGHASAWGPGSGRTRAQRCQSSRSIRPRLRNLCAHWGGKSFPRSPRARVRSTNTGVLRRGPGAPRSSPYGTSGRHWDLTETFLTPLRLQGFGASASAARLDTRPSARGERVLDRPVTPPHDSVHVIATKLLLQPDTTKLR